MKPNQKWGAGRKKISGTVWKKEQNKKLQNSGQVHEGEIVKQKNGRSVSIQLQQPVKKEINRLLQEAHIVKVAEIKKVVSSQPTAITIEKDRSVRIELDAREL